jgi:thiosulfate dehydrogenase
MKNLVSSMRHAALLIVAITVLAAMPLLCNAQTLPAAKDKLDTIWTVPQVGALPDDNYGRLVRRGRDLVTATYAHIGPDVNDPAKRYAGNNLACGNCHLEAGTKRFGLPIFGLYDAFPRYSAREGAEITIELDRAADPARGGTIYLAKCAGCHNTDGSGIPRSLPATDLGYMVPPLWGPQTFNDGAGMDRLITAANFVHSDMPQGADYLNPVLPTADAWDVAAFVVSQPRPHKAGLEKDFPDLAEKPVDTPYGPYLDGFSETQHKYGPFAPIRAALARLKEKR